MRKKIAITYTKERVILSDVLPYETPLTFSNRYFYKYLIKRRKNKNKKRVFSEIEGILFNSRAETVPFSFNISHKQDDFRELKVIHPLSQVKVSDFYEKYKDLILYYCSISPFSIRKPSKVAKFSFYNDMLHKRNKDGDLEHSMIEQDDSEYENLKSYFSYQKYSNIHKFYESYQFHRCEKKYNKLLKIDISKCFDSIYSHSISWAIFNKSIVKENIDPSRNTFGGDFDELMQKLNANETNGIVIGPEFSRIFAEIILQQIDKNIFDNLNNEKEESKRLKHKVDYEIFRYVDDYFVFFNYDNDSERILKEFRLCFKEYKMYINDSKSIVYEKPIITDISIAKQKISDLFNEQLKFVLETKEDEINDLDEKKTKSNFYFTSNNVITKFKSIIKETGIDYKDIMNYSLAVLDKKILKLINKYKILKEEEKNNKIEKCFEKGFLEILDVAFFLYSVSPRVNSTIKLCLIINKIITFLKKSKLNKNTEPFNKNSKHHIFKKLSDEIYLILQKNKAKQHTQIETLYLLIAQSQLGREYRLDSKLLCSYFCIDVKPSGELVFNTPLNYFSITVLLFYIKDISQYLNIKEQLKLEILYKFKNSIQSEWKNKSEIVMLLLDLLTCPFLNEDVPKYQKDKLRNATKRKSKNLKKYISEVNNHKYKYKKELLNLFDIKSNQILLIEEEKFWFTKWTDFDFGMELQAKRSQEVY